MVDLYLVDWACCWWIWLVAVGLMASLESSESMAVSWNVIFTLWLMHGGMRLWDLVSSEALASGAEDEFIWPAVELCFLCD